MVKDESLKEQNKRGKEMETKKVTKPVTRRKRKLTPEENRALNIAIKPQNRFMEAALKHQGSFIVYDPNFML